MLKTNSEGVERQYPLTLCGNFLGRGGKKFEIIGGKMQIINSKLEDHLRPGNPIEACMSSVPPPLTAIYEFFKMEGCNIAWNCDIILSPQNHLGGGYGNMDLIFRLFRTLDPPVKTMKTPQDWDNTIDYWMQLGKTHQKHRLIKNFCDSANNFKTH